MPKCSLGQQKDIFHLLRDLSRSALYLLLEGIHFLFCACRRAWKSYRKCLVSSNLVKLKNPDAMESKCVSVIQVRSES